MQLTSFSVLEWVSFSKVSPGRTVFLGSVSLRLWWSLGHSRRVCLVIEHREILLSEEEEREFLRMQLGST